MCYKIKKYLKSSVFFAFISQSLFFSEVVSAEIYLRADSFSYSEPVPIDQLVHNMEGPEPVPGDVAFTFNSAELGATIRNWEIASFSRLDYFLEFNPDTVDLFYRDANDIPYPTNRDYKVKLEPNHIQGVGFGIGYLFSISSNLSVKPRLNYIQADVVTDGYLRGDITANEEDGYVGELYLDYIYKEDVLLERVEEEISGDGFSLDLFARWNISDQWMLIADLKDYYSAIEWDHVTFTTAQANTNTVTFDEEGRLESAPVMFGREFYRDSTQKLPRKGKLVAKYQLTKNHSFSGQLDHVESYMFSRFAWQGSWGGVGTSIGYQLETEAFDVAFTSKFFSIKLIADNTDAEAAHVLGLNLKLAVPVF